MLSCGVKGGGKVVAQALSASAGAVHVELRTLRPRHGLGEGCQRTGPGHAFSIPSIQVFPLF